MSKSIFKPCNILLPDTDTYDKWAVIACDQFTSEPQYWEKTKKIIGDAKSALNLILPEVYLSKDNTEAVSLIHDTMKQYEYDGLFKVIEHGFIYVERTLQNGDIRPGVLGIIDLEDYSFEKGVECRIRPTEKTVVERIPPRKMARQKAIIELPHIIQFSNHSKDGTMC